MVIAPTVCYRLRPFLHLETRTESPHRVKRSENREIFPHLSQCPSVSGSPLTESGIFDIDIDISRRCLIDFPLPVGHPCRQLPNSRLIDISASSGCADKIPGNFFNDLGDPVRRSRPRNLSVPPLRECVIHLLKLEIRANLAPISVN